MREQERRRSRRNRMLVAGGSAVLLVVVLVVVQQLTSSGSSRPDASNLTGVADVQTEFAGLTERAGTIGNPSAKVTITEFGDLRCPICKTFDNEVAPQVISDIVRPGTAKLTYKTWPILGPNSIDAAKAAYAASQQNRLWRYAALDLPEPGRRERGVVHAGRGARHRPRRRPRHGALREGPRQPGCDQGDRPGHERSDDARASRAPRRSASRAPRERSPWMPRMTPSRPASSR